MLRCVAGVLSGVSVVGTGLGGNGKSVGTGCDGRVVAGRGWVEAGVRPVGGRARRPFGYGSATDGTARPGASPSCIHGKSPVTVGPTSASSADTGPGRPARRGRYPLGTSPAGRRPGPGTPRRTPVAEPCRRGRRPPTGRRPHAGCRRLRRDHDTGGRSGPGHAPVAGAARGACRLVRTRPAGTAAPGRGHRAHRGRTGGRSPRARDARGDRDAWPSRRRYVGWKVLRTALPQAAEGVVPVVVTLVARRRSRPPQHARRCRRPVMP